MELHQLRYLLAVAKNGNFSRAAEQVRGKVSVGVIPTIAPPLLPRANVLGYGSPHSRATTAQLLVSAAACEIDLAIVSLPITDARFVREPLFDEELLLAVPPRHPLTKKSRVRLSDVEDERFILMEEGHCLTDQSLRFRHHNDLHPQVAFRSAQLETIQALVASGVGISLIPKLALHAQRPGQPV